MRLSVTVYYFLIFSVLLIMMLMRTMIVMIMMMMTTMTTGCSRRNRHIGQRWAAATVVGLEAEVPSYPLVATNLPSGHSFCHRIIIIIIVIIVIIVGGCVVCILPSKFQTTLEDIS